MSKRLNVYLDIAMQTHFAGYLWMLWPYFTLISDADLETVLTETFYAADSKMCVKLFYSL